ncbi:hypothetical protein ACFYMI_07090 [Streptomyces collinus]|uniref:hypothetical protein n=1 Tax=Streptomyces collinus TaxID=42684 RepID=UPI0036A045AD
MGLQYWLTDAQSFDGLLCPAAGVRSVVAFVEARKISAAESVDEQRLVTERVGDRHHTATTFGTRGVGKLKLYAAASVEVPNDLLVRHVWSL